jgi:hypothetical protein
MSPMEESQMPRRLLDLVYIQLERTTQSGDTLVEVSSDHSLSSKVQWSISLSWRANMPQAGTPKVPLRYLCIKNFGT